MILFFVIYILISLYLSFSRPTLFICAYILFYTQFLGFISNNIIFSGVDYGSFVLNCALIFPLIFQGKIQKTFDSTTKSAIIFVIFFILYGVLKPYFDGAQSVLMGLKAGKSFWTYIILIYLMLYRRDINFNYVFSFIKCIAFYFSFLYIINATGLGLIPPIYVKGDYLQCQYDSFIVFAIIILYYQQFNGISIRLFPFKILLLITGLLLGGYFSLLATSLVLLIVFLIRKYSYSPVDYFIFIVISGMILLVITQFVTNTDWFYNIQLQQANALMTRNEFNEFRWDLIQKNQWFGYGFLDKSSEIVKSHSSSSVYAETFSFIDAGYIDLLGRFGWIIMLVFLLYPLKYLLSSIKDKELFPFSMFIVQFFCVNYTWAVFSFPMGIIPLSITYAFIAKKISNGKKTSELACC